VERIQITEGERVRIEQKVRAERHKQQTLAKIRELAKSISVGIKMKEHGAFARASSNDERPYAVRAQAAPAPISHGLRLQPVPAACIPLPEISLFCDEDR
jgi:hypothetical protein